MEIRYSTVFENESIGGRWNERGSSAQINWKALSVSYWEFKVLTTLAGGGALLDIHWVPLPCYRTSLHLPDPCTLLLHEKVNQTFFPTLPHLHPAL